VGDGQNAVQLEVTPGKPLKSYNVSKLKPWNEYLVSPLEEGMEIEGFTELLLTLKKRVPMPQSTAQKPKPQPKKSAAPKSGTAPEGRNLRSKNK